MELIYDRAFDDRSAYRAVTTGVAGETFHYRSAIPRVIDYRSGRSTRTLQEWSPMSGLQLLQEWTRNSGNLNVSTMASIPWPTGVECKITTMEVREQYANTSIEVREPKSAKSVFVNRGTRARLPRAES